MKRQKILCFVPNAAQGFDEQIAKADCECPFYKIKEVPGYITVSNTQLGLFSVRSNDMWKIKQIAEADFGCEERMPGEKLKCLVILEDKSGNVRYLEVEDEWLTEQGLDEGSEWKD